MQLHYWYMLFVEQIKETTPLQWIVLVTGVAEVLLARINNVWLYPAGIISTLLSIYLLLQVQLYADSLLNVYYVVMSIYGWIYWLKKADKLAVEISWCTPAEWVVTAAISILGGLFLYYVLKTYTPSNVPAWDAWVSSTAWAGMWLLARRKIENWALLNLSNIFAIPLLFYKKLPLFGALTIFLFIIGTIGFFDWVKIYKRKQKTDALKATL